MTRDSLSWPITIPPDGRLPLDRAAPGLIQWSAPEHPANALPDSGCSLEALEICHPQSELLNILLREIAFDGTITVSLHKTVVSASVAWARISKGVCVMGEP
jgi:hypothetical protein